MPKKSVAAVRTVAKKTVKKIAKKTTKKTVEKAAPNLWVTVRRSRIHGNGVFAKRLIPEGTRIIEYVGEKVTKAESDRRADEVLARAQNKAGKGAVYIFTLNERYDIDGNVPWNPARFINHACETNCESDIIRGHIWLVATRDIERGEELHYDYGYDMSNWKEHRCRCRKPTCLGYIVASHNRWRVRRQLLCRGQKF